MIQKMEDKESLFLECLLTKIHDIGLFNFKSFMPYTRSKSKLFRASYRFLNNSIP